jgi:hypothetical protein
MNFKFSKNKAITALVGLGLVIALTFGGIVAYNANKGPLRTSNAVSISQDSTKVVKLTRFDQNYVTLIPFFKDSSNFMFKDCERIKFRVIVEDNHMVLISNGSDVLVKGTIVSLIDNNQTLVGTASNLVSKDIPFSLTRFTPALGSTAPDSTSMCLIFHLGSKQEPFYILSKKKTCSELVEYLQIN